MNERRLCPAYGKRCAKCGRPNLFAAVCRRSGNEEDGNENLASLEQQECDPDGRESWQFLPVTQQENNVALMTNKGEVNMACAQSRWSGQKKIFADLGINGHRRQFQNLQCSGITWSFATHRPEANKEDPEPVWHNNNRGSLQRTGEQPIHHERVWSRVSSRQITASNSNSRCSNLFSNEFSSYPTSANAWSRWDSANWSHNDNSPQEGGSDQEISSIVWRLTGSLSRSARLEIVAEGPQSKLPLCKIPPPLKEDLQNELWLSLSGTRGQQNGFQVLSWQGKPMAKKRVGLDPKPLDEGLKRTLYPLQGLDSILPRLQKAAIFSICDISSGYLHVSLDEQSSQLTTFATLFWRFRWQRLPFGISETPGIFSNAAWRS